MITLPDKYCDSMIKLLGEAEFKEYLESFSDNPLYAIRVNSMKVSLEEWNNICPFDTRKISWTEKGFIIDEEARLAASKHPYYFAGLYYIQEPSAMIPAGILPIDKDDKVLDLCAAPGGKATEIAARLNGSGILVANDISVSRAMALAKNLQLAGVANVVVTAETPQNLAACFKEYFDKIIIDAPCSGEGMFRRKPGMVKDWIEKGPEYYAEIQRDILKEAYGMLKPGGSMVYSTCTFSVEEDEGMIQWFVNEYKDMEICETGHREGFSYGRPDLIDSGCEELKRCIRIFPHKAEGEGHFAALLHKKDMSETAAVCEGGAVKSEDRSKPHGKSKAKTDIWQEEAKDFIAEEYFENYSLKMRNNTVQMIPDETVRLNSLRIIQNGLIAGEFKKHFEPSQQLALTMSEKDYNNRVELKSTDINVIKYLKGETISVDTYCKGWVLVTVDGYPLGWAKGNGQGSLKNKYYAGWRMQ